MGDTGEGSSTLTLINKLDIGDPLYLHPTDTTTGTHIISIKVKGTENYNIWSRSMLLALGTKNKRGFINGTCVESTTDNALASQWNWCNIVVLSWMLGTLSEELYNGQIFGTNALTVWNDLKETYDKIDGSVIFNLHQKINSLKKNDSPLSKYYHNINSLWKQYDSMVSSPPCTCGANACNCDASSSVIQNNNRLKLMQFLMGLNDAYMSVRSNILLRDHLPDVKTTYAVISREESHRTSSLKDFNNKTQITAFAMLKLLSLINDVPSAHVGSMANTEGNFLNSSVKFNLNFSKFYNSNLSQSKPIHQGWIIDSGANQHMISSDKRLSNVVDIFGLRLTVGHPNGTQDLIKSIGYMVINECIILKNILVVPEYRANLMSVHKLTKDNKLIVSFDNDKCYIQDLRDKKLKEIGNQNGGLYVFDKTDNAGKIPHLNKTHCYSPINIWHSRLGHPSDQVLNVLKTKLKLKDKILTGPCDICHKAKQSRKPFPLSDHKTTDLGKIIHLDLWGSFEVQTREGFKYFLTVVDDYSGAVWIFLIKSKEEVTPSAALNEKSPYEMIYKTDPNLSHLKCFGCLCYATDLNPSNKFSIRSIKCVLIGFSTVKKSYKLLSLEDKSIFYSRDVTFYETIFPLKIKHKDVLSVSSENLFQTNRLSKSNFFDDIFETSVNTLSPNDEGRSAEHCDGSSDDNHVDDHCLTITHHEDNTSIPEGNINSNDSFENTNLRRSSRSTVFPKKFDDFVVD
ncbi:uncharacterized protein [Rutidosis leptorrhynchoides]|uniref:uncharacterized protein n=1 Tax=Rutidosis leptorrhynchoides TaxID=125765 RepID=UPI003A9A41A1